MVKRKKSTAVHWAEAKPQITEVEMKVSVKDLRWSCLSKRSLNNAHLVLAIDVLPIACLFISAHWWVNPVTQYFTPPQLVSPVWLI